MEWAGGSGEQEQKAQKGKRLFVLYLIEANFTNECHESEARERNTVRSTFPTAKLCGILLTLEEHLELSQTYVIFMVCEPRTNAFADTSPPPSLSQWLPKGVGAHTDLMFVWR